MIAAPETSTSGYLLIETPLAFSAPANNRSKRQSWGSGDLPNGR
jgi:hypothetical protein